MSEDISIEVRQAILEQKLAFWKQTAWSLGIDARLAGVIESAEMLENATAQLKQALKMVDLLEKELAGLK